MTDVPPPVPKFILSGIDAFAAAPFKGNPAAVCLMPEGVERDGAWLQKLAAELNLPATAFLQPQSDGDGYGLRWFSAKNELALCGHGTLASTHFLWDQGFLKTNDVARYVTRAGVLTAVHDGVSVHLDFPSRKVEAVEVPDALQVAIGENEILFAGQNTLDLLVELASEDAVRALTPNLERLASIDVRAVIVTARGSGEYDCVSRFFAPRTGTSEDYVTGSAHCALAPYWAAKLGRSTLLAYQASARGGVLQLGVEGERVRIGGQAVTVWRGELSAAEW